MKTPDTIEVMGVAIWMSKVNNSDYINLTDMVKHFGDDAMIYTWMRNRNTLEFIWWREELYNSDFKGYEFDTFRKQAGLNNFNLTPKKWIESTNAVWFVSKAGRYGWWTFAHKDIAFEFATWLSPKFKLYLIKEFQRLKEQETKSIDWNVKRFLTKVNYRLHTDAIKDHIVPSLLDNSKLNFIYADEADVLNMALFGKTAKEWREKNPEIDGNMRDEASIEQLIVLANLESMNAEYIKLWISQSERIASLNHTAITQMTSLVAYDLNRRLPW